MDNPKGDFHSKDAIQAVDLCKTFEKFQALKNLSFSVKKGEIFGLLGPNGAGKTTCMKIFGGILLPTSGMAFIDGVNVVEKPILAKSKIGFLPEFRICGSPLRLLMCSSEYCSCGRMCISVEKPLLRPAGLRPDSGRCRESDLRLQQKGRE